MKALAGCLALILATSAFPQSSAFPKNYNDIQAGKAWFEATPRKSPMTDELIASFILRAAPNEPLDPVRGELYMTCSDKRKAEAGFGATRTIGDLQQDVLIRGSAEMHGGQSWVETSIRIDDMRVSKSWERNRSMTVLKIDDETMKALFKAKLVVIGFNDDVEQPHFAVFKMADVDSSRVIDVCGLAPKN